MYLWSEKFTYLTEHINIFLLKASRETANDHRLLQLNEASDTKIKSSQGGDFGPERRSFTQLQMCHCYPSSILLTPHCLRSDAGAIHILQTFLKVQCRGFHKIYTFQGIREVGEWLYRSGFTETSVLPRRYWEVSTYSYLKLYISSCIALR